MTSTGSAPADDVTRPAATAEADRWKAFIAIAISFVTMVFSMSMVFVALSAIADDFDTTVEALTGLNPDVDPLKLKPGDRIRVR